MPAVQALAKELLGKTPYKGLSHDEAIALGAAIQGGILNAEVTETVLLDVTPLSLGIETLGGIMSKIIERNTKIPTQGKKIFSTTSDRQTEVLIKVYQGEQEVAKYNKFLADFRLSGLPTARRGEPQIEVLFDIDVNGIVHVTAMDILSGKKQQIQISSTSGLSDEEIARMSEVLQR